MASTSRIALILCFTVFTASALFADEPKTLSGHKDWVTAIAFSPNGRLLASGSRDATIKLWDVKTGAVVASLTDHETGISCLAFAADGKRLASGSADKTIRIWDISSRDSLKSLAVLKGHDAVLTSLSFSPDGLQLASSSLDGTVMLWDPKTGLGKSFAKSDGNVFCVSFSPDGKAIAWPYMNAGAFGFLLGTEVRITSIDKGDLLGSFKDPSNVILVFSIFSDGKTMATASSDDKVKLWNLKTFEKTAEFEAKDVMSLATSNDGRFVVAGKNNGYVYAWDMSHSKQRFDFNVHSGKVRSVSVSPDSSLIASGSEDNTIKLWRVETAGDNSEAPKVSESRNSERAAPQKLKTVPKNWPNFSGELSGSNPLRVRNPNEFEVRVGVRSSGKGVDFVVPANDAGSTNVPNGKYDIYFQYSSDPDGVYQGDSFTLDNNGVEIKIVKVVNGNFGIRKIK